MTVMLSDGKYAYAWQSQNYFDLLADSWTPPFGKKAKKNCELAVQKLPRAYL